MDKFLCPDDQHPSENSVNIVFLQQTVSFTNMNGTIVSDDVISHGTCTPDRYYYSIVSDITMRFVSAVVSEIRELKEDNSEMDYFQFNTFPGHLIYPFFNQRYLLSTCTDSIC